MTEFNIETFLLDNQKPCFILPRGGEQIAREFTCVKENPLILAAVKDCAERWPEENAHCLNALQHALESNPNLDGWLACETAFFANLPQRAADYALPEAMFTRGYLRFGGDGLLHHWASLQLPQHRNLVSFHVCDHPTLAAIHDGKAVDCSQGYSSVEGLPSNCSCGTIDPTIPLLLAENGYSPDQIAKILYMQSGWGEDVHLLDLVNSTDPKLAVLRQHITDAIVKALGEAFAALGSGDTSLVLLLDEPMKSTGWIERLCKRFAFAGFKYGNPVKEASAWVRHSAPDSAHAVLSRCVNRQEMLRELFFRNQH